MDSAVLSKLGRLDESELRTKVESSSGEPNIANGMTNAPTSTTTTTLLLEQRLDKLLMESDNQVESVKNSKTMGVKDQLDRNGMRTNDGGDTSAVSGMANKNTQNGRKLANVEDCNVAKSCDDDSSSAPCATSKYDMSTPGKLLDHEVMYYGVCRPPTATLEDDDLAVYTDKKEALRAVKKHKGARFKAFKTSSEATAFASQLADETFNSPSVGSAGVTTAKDTDASFDTNGASGEKPSPFRPPKPQDLVKLRKAIESDDLEFVEQTIWSNPRYLISSGDTPAILQEGSRYNALHVAAKSKRFAVVKLVLDIIENQEFMQLLYSDDSEDTCLQRIDFLTDLYLNTPDKGLCETPLHFAAKFGCAKIVEVLASYPACDRERRNKYGQAAKDSRFGFFNRNSDSKAQIAQLQCFVSKGPVEHLKIICSRCPNNGNAELRAEIEEYLQDRYYVPVLRTEDNSTQPLVGEPWSPAEAKQKSLIVAQPQPQQMPLTVKAYAGPMSPQQAQEFHKRLKTPTRSSRRVAEISAGSQDFRLSDTDKGLERVGRRVAKDMNVLWTEYWSFLKGFYDVTKPEGLNKLELYLKNKFNDLMAKDCNRSFDSESNDCFIDDKGICNTNVLDRSDKIDLNVSQNSSGIGALSEGLERLRLNSSSCSSGSANSPKPSSAVERNPFGVPSYSQSNNGVCSSVSKPSSVNNGSPRAMNVASFLERTCQVVASQIYSELSRFAEAQQDYWLNSDLPYRLFTKALLSPVECLQNIVRNLRLCDELKGSDFKVIHFTVTRKICEAIEDDDNVFVRDFLEKIVSFPEGSVEYFSEQSDVSDEEEIGVETPSKWEHRRQRNNQKKRRLSTMMQQHLRCILNIMMNISKQKKLAVEVDPLECTCSWFSCHVEGVNAPLSPSSKFANDEPRLSKTNGCLQSSETGHATSAPVVCLSREQARPGIGDGSELNFSPAKSDCSVYFTPPSSNCSSLSEMESADEGPAVFVEGLYPTKLDLDILRAIDNVQVDVSLYPHIYRWKNTITSYPTEVIESWPSPSCPRARRNVWSIASSSLSSTPARQSFPSCSSTGTRSRLVSSTPKLLPPESNEIGNLRTNLMKALTSPKSASD